MQSTPSLPSLPGPLRPKVVAHDRVLSVYLWLTELIEIELFCHSAV